VVGERFLIVGRNELIRLENVQQIDEKNSARRRRDAVDGVAGPNGGRNRGSPVRAKERQKTDLKKAKTF
jgi:hypothetical protein